MSRDTCKRGEEIEYNISYVFILWQTRYNIYFSVPSTCNTSTPGKNVTSPLREYPPDLKENQRKTVTSFPPLAEPIPNLPKAVYSTAKEEHQTTQITVLPNGLKVVSESRFGQFCTISGELSVILLLYQLSRFV